MPDLFPQIVVPHDHAAPYCDPWMAEDVPFVTIGPFASTDTLFPGTAGDLELFTDEEVIALSNVGVLKSSITSMSTHKLPSLASRWNQTHLSGNETTEILQGATGILYPWPLEVVKTWTSQNMNVRLHTNNFTERSMLNAVPQKQGVNPWVHNQR